MPLPVKPVPITGTCRKQITALSQAWPHALSDRRPSPGPAPAAWPQHQPHMPVLLPDTAPCLATASSHLPSQA